MTIDLCRLLIVGTAMAGFVVCCVMPAVFLFATSLGVARSAYAAAMLDARQLELLFNTAVLGAGTALLATGIGTPLGVALARVPLRRTAVLRLALAAPLLLPPYVVGLAWLYLDPSGSTNSLPAAILVLSALFYPISMLATEVAMRRIDGRLEEAALIVAPPRRVLWRITAPLAAPGILAAALLIFVLAVSEFGVPAILRVRVYTTEVFTAFAALYDVTRASALAVPLLVLCAAAGAMAAGVLGDPFVTARRAAGTHPIAFDTWRPAAIQLMSVLIVAVLVFPIVILVREAAYARSLRDSLSGSGDAVANSLVLSAIGATAVVALAVPLGYTRARAHHRAGHLADIACIVLFAVPSTIVGVGLITLWNRPGLLGMAYGTDAMLLLVYLARFVPVAAVISAVSVRYVAVSQEEAAAVSGARWIRTFGRIVLPQIGPGLAAAWTLTFVLSFGELGASILVAPPGEATLPIRIYTMIANAPTSHVAALALLQTSVILTPLAIVAAVASLREAR